MIGKGSGNRPEAGAVERFGELLSRHLDRGTRPEGSSDTEGIPWTVKEFAAAVRVSERSVRAWCADNYLPLDLRPVERALFGNNPAYGEFRNDLRRLYRLIRGGGDQSIEAAFNSAAPELVSRSELRRDTYDLLANEFKDGVAYFQTGPGRVVLFTDPEKALVRFREVINRLWAVDRADGRERMLVWLLDLGRQDFDDRESCLRFMSVEALTSRFKALRRFKESVTEARWNWLQSRAIIVLHDTCSVRPDVPRLPAFDPQHVLFGAVPHKWIDLPGFIALYGDGRIAQANYMIFLRRSADESPYAEPSDHQAPSPVRPSYALRYFANALLKSDETDETEFRSVELNAPGAAYVEALGTVFAAAAHMLEFRSVSAELSIDGMKIDAAHAIEKLRHHGFLLLRLNEFMML
ncbi:MAG TPA: hypothetical protein VKP67_15280 [Xanthobacteraceae bacterium]|nr:hypothetical protein [Xanthobacteraceae bacterium]